ncbi:hypothetical protein BDN72DRAFT_877472 [Pluteus cervinus]|uniref:Uncharacterized protein n=1 Tax=Pluteus cervinus TaxID=181527 RepID=A0ACD3AZ96_9AGAR|nr:hypothetical protein BDN72DRAFT_877472 [Pluteus cervinus]
MEKWNYGDIQDTVRLFGYESKPRKSGGEISGENPGGEEEGVQTNGSANAEKNCGEERMKGRVAAMVVTPLPRIHPLLGHVAAACRLGGVRFIKKARSFGQSLERDTVQTFVEKALLDDPCGYTLSFDAATFGGTLSQPKEWTRQRLASP